MKKFLLSLFLIFSTHYSYAQTASNTLFVPIEALMKEKKFTEAYDSLEKLAKEGHSEALYHQAYFYQHGYGVAQDQQKALKLLKQASQKGVAIASYRLAQGYLQKDSAVKYDLNQGKKYLMLAEQQGLEQATIDLAMLLFADGTPASEKAGLAKLEPLIKANNAAAQYAKALHIISQGIKTQSTTLFQEGLMGIQQLAEQGFIPALLSVATLYMQGTVVEQNLPEAKKILMALKNADVPQAEKALAIVEDMMNKQTNKN